MNSVPSNGRHGVVAVLMEEGKFLAIRRSAFVRAPRLVCFPGGSIEPNEDFPTAIRREMLEELALEVEVIEHIWTSRTSWGTDLEWMLVKRANDRPPVPNAAEVEEVFWLTQSELLSHPDLLGSLPDFFGAIESSLIALDRAERPERN